MESWLNRIDSTNSEYRKISNIKLLKKAKTILSYNRANNWIELFSNNHLLKTLPPKERMKVNYSYLLALCELLDSEI